MEKVHKISIDSVPKSSKGWSWRKDIDSSNDNISINYNNMKSEGSSQCTIMATTKMVKRRFLVLKFLYHMNLEFT